VDRLIFIRMISARNATFKIDLSVGSD